MVTGGIVDRRLRGEIHTDSPGGVGRRQCIGGQNASQSSRCGNGLLARRRNFARAEERIKKILQGATPAQDAGLDGADAALENLGDFFVAEAFKVAQNHGAAERMRDLLQSLVHNGLKFLRSEKVEGRGAGVFDFESGVPLVGSRIDGNVFLEMALEPAAVIERFADSDAVEPGLERAAAMEAANSLEGFQKNFLSSVGGIGSITEHADD